MKYFSIYTRFNSMLAKSCHERCIAYQTAVWRCDERESKINKIGCKVSELSAHLPKFTFTSGEWKQECKVLGGQYDATGLTLEKLLRAFFLTALYTSLCMLRKQFLLTSGAALPGGAHKSLLHVQAVCQIWAWQALSPVFFCADACYFCNNHARMAAPRKYKSGSYHYPPWPLQSITELESSL